MSKQIGLVDVHTHRERSNVSKWSVVSLLTLEKNVKGSVYPFSQRTQEMLSGGIASLAVDSTSSPDKPAAKKPKTGDHQPRSSYETPSSDNIIDDKDIIDLTEDDKATEPDIEVLAVKAPTNTSEDQIYGNRTDTQAEFMFRNSVQRCEAAIMGFQAVLKTCVDNGRVDQVAHIEKVLWKAMSKLDTKT